MIAKQLELRKCIGKDVVFLVGLVRLCSLRDIKGFYGNEKAILESLEINMQIVRTILSERETEKLNKYLTYIVSKTDRLVKESTSMFVPQKRKVETLSYAVEISLLVTPYQSLLNGKTLVLQDERVYGELVSLANHYVSMIEHVYKHFKR